MKTDNVFTRGSNRRAFLKNGTMTAGAATVSAGLLATRAPAFAKKGPEEKSGRLTAGVPGELIRWKVFNEM